MLTSSRCLYSIDECILACFPGVPIFQTFCYPGFKNPQRPEQKAINYTPKLDGMQQLSNIATPYTRHSLKWIKLSVN